MGDAALRGGTLPSTVEVVEVGPRDGFQMEESFIPTELKIRAIEGLAEAGLREIEAVSFVHPRVIPQMRDADEVMAGLRRRPGTRYTALVPNLRGAERALDAGVDGLHLVICVTETYNRRNVGLSVAESLEALSGIVSRASASGVPVRVAVTMAATFGCPFEGQLATAGLVGIAREIVERGADELGLADSAGLGHPLLVEEILDAVVDAVPDVALRLHLHDTRGLGLANAMVGLRRGIRRFDTSLGGLGGCPVMRGASGNIATEDFVNLCEESGIDTGVDLDGVRRVSREIAGFLGRPLESRVLRAGTRDELHALNR